METPENEVDDDKGCMWQVRVRKNLDTILDDYIKKDTHSTKSEFIRQAVREKLERAGVQFTQDTMDALNAKD
jgi:Arc/MetJ-type ribon-helix-helix transcriptional regulator